MKFRCFSILLGSFFVFSADAPAQTASPAPHPVTIYDYFRIREVEDPQISPDSQWVSYTVKTALLKEDKNRSRIWMLPRAGGEAIPLTSEDTSSHHGRWSPDGKLIAFLSERNGGKTQIWLLNRLGGEAQQVTDTPQDVEDFAWSPDGRRLVLVLRDASPEELETSKDRAEAKDKDPEAEPADAAAAAAEKEKKKTPKPWVVDRLHFKEDTIGYLDRRRTHLYTLELASKSPSQITFGDFDDSGPAWSPDSKRLAFASNRSKPDPDANYNSDIWVVAADNKDKEGHLIQVTTGVGDDREPSWSPDGKWITYITETDAPLFVYATKHVAISPASGGEAKVLTLKFDRVSKVPRFSPDGKFIYFIADDDGTQNICRISTSGGEVTRPLGGRLMVSGYALGKGGDIVAEVATIDRPAELYTIPAGKRTQLTHVNDGLIKQLKVSVGEYVKFKSPDGTLVAGYLYKPVDYTPGKKYPTILRPHGGPVWAYYAEFDHLAQLLAANGYVVLYPNPRGSTGYGQEFSKAIFADWGVKDYQDDMAMVDYAIAQGIADPDKLGVGGWSYGGISTNFIIVQTTRFKAAISGAGEALYITNFGHDHYSRDWVYELGVPWEHREVYERLSPFNKVKNVTTPTLFMGGDSDWNVPIINGEQFYQALKMLGRETELVVYPGEFHGFTAPSHIKDRLERYLAWYGHYVKGDPSPARPQPRTAK